MNIQTDHLGNTFPSLAAMCKAYGLSTPAYISRRKRGWSLENILTTPLGKGSLGYEHFVEQKACYQELHKEEIREYQRNYRETHKEKMKKYQEAYKRKPKTRLEESKNEIIFL